jgi:hypothetical protein
MIRPAPPILVTFIFWVFCFTLVDANDTPKTAHVFVALCDNINQGIVPVPSFLGNGQDPANNLYWGAKYGVKTYLKNSDKWKIISRIKDPAPHILERCVFEFGEGKAYLVADAYDGAHIKSTIMDFLESASGNNLDSITVDNISIQAGGGADLIAYVGHNGLMDFDLDEYPLGTDSVCRDAVILACLSKSFFRDAIDSAGACPLLWTTGLMAPEAYTLAAAIEAWIDGSTSETIRSRAAEAYHRYQKCGLKAAKRLLVTDKP